MNLLSFNNQKKERQKRIQKRILAFTIDIFVILFLQKALLWAYKDLLHNMMVHMPMYEKKITQAYLPLMEFFTILTVYFFYFSISLYWGQGRTLGKAILGLKVYSLSSEHGPNLLESFQRALGYLVCYMSANLLFILPVIRKDGKGLADWISGTFVVPENFKPETIKAQPVGLPYLNAYSTPIALGHDLHNQEDINSYQDESPCIDEDLVQDKAA